MKSSEIKTVDLTVHRHIPRTSPEDVYDVWVDPQSPGGPWFGSTTLVMHPAKPTVGGMFYTAMEHAGQRWPHFGRFVALERAKLVENTWMSRSTKGLETTVRVTFAAKDGGTQVTLVHLGVPDDEMGRQHQGGWDWMLGMLAESMDKRGAGANATAT
jgi:uncharacterized protein YndB with AHSA1/START domain